MSLPRHGENPAPQPISRTTTPEPSETSPPVTAVKIDLGPDRPNSGMTPEAWPAGMDPAEAPVFAHNALYMEASPTTIFNWLKRADLWPTYYANSSHVEVNAPSAPDLSLDAHFRWTTFHMPLKSQVLLYDEGRSLGWEAKGPGLRAYHKWILIPEGTGTRVVTEETDTGIVAKWGAFYIKRELLRQHQRWLEGLRTMAAQGDPQAIGR